MQFPSNFEQSCFFLLLYVFHFYIFIGKNLNLFQRKKQNEEEKTSTFFLVRFLVRFKSQYRFWFISFFCGKMILFTQFQICFQF